MRNLTRKLSLFVAALLSLLFFSGACNASISRNADRSLTVETTISQEELQDAISASIADPLIQEITVSLQSGYALVSGVRERLNDPAKTDTLAFRLDLSVSNGQLTASISNAQLDGHPIPEDRVDHWNETIANRIAKLGKKNPNSTIQSVTVSPEAVTMTWNVSR